MSARSRTRPLQRTWWPWLPLGVVLALALGIGSFGSRGPITDEDRALAIARVVQCPQCAGETAAESNAPAAQMVRIEIDAQVRAGRSDEEIIAAMEDKYPGRVLTPPRGGLAGLVWVLPVAALVVATAGLAVAFRRWGESADRRATDADRRLVERALAAQAGDPGAGPDGADQDTTAGGKGER
jgi:cytochrome c-type biogenesis protein CcmH